MSATITLMGAAVGSFLNVVVHRLPRGESLVSPRSTCPGCDVAILPRDNVPIVSWMILRGRCRHCGERISARYPLLEGVTTILFAAIVFVRGFDLELLLQLPFAAVLVAVAAIDLEHRIIPNRILLPAALYGVACSAAIRPGELPELAVAGGAAFALLLIAALAYPAGMGMGDVKLAGVMGLYLGVSVAPALLLAFGAGSLVGLAILVREGSSARKKAVPFAPFLAFGGLVGLLAGPELVELYRDQLLS